MPLLLPPSPTLRGLAARDVLSSLHRNMNADCVLQKQGTSIMSILVKVGGNQSINQSIYSPSMTTEQV